MRRLIVAGLLTLAVSGAAYGVDYTFTGTRFTEVGGNSANWDNVLNWTPNLILPGTTGDNYLIPSTVARTQQIRPPNTAAGQTRYFGQLTMYGGNLYLQGSGTLRFVADNGLTGGIYLNTVTAQVGWSYTGTGPTFDIDGSIIMNPATGTTVIYPARLRVIMRGNNTTYRVASGSESYNQPRMVVVDNGLTVNFQAPSGGKNWNDNIVFNSNSTTTGSVASSILKRAKITRGADVNTRDLNVYLSFYENDWGSGGNTAARQGTGIFLTPGLYRDVDMGNAWNNVTATARYGANCIGDLRVRNLYIQYNAAGGQRATYVLNTDNGITSNITTDCDLFIGRNSTTSNWVVGLNAGGSTIDVGRDLIIKGGGSNGANYMAFTTGTLRVGRHLTVENGIGTGSLWNMGTSTAIFDGNFGSDCGTYAAQTITSKGLPFHSVEVNNPGGTVTLADNLVMKGDFYLAAGTLAAGTNYLVFKGGIDNVDIAQEIDVDTSAALSRIYIMAGSNSFVKLMSDLSITDNLDIDTGCKLFLNGFTLDLTGSDAALFLGQNTLSGEGTWALKEGGEIVGTAPIPEPATWLLLGTGALGVIGYVRRRRMS